MEPCSVNTMARRCGGELLRGGPQEMVCGVGTDSRQVQAGQAFVALAGEHSDGHDFLMKAAERGAAAVIVEQAKLRGPLPPCAVIAVSDTRQALLELAASYRREFSLPIVAITGSAGKTSCKDAVGAVLGQRLTTLATEGNYNNAIGVPLTLLQLERRHQAAVVEVGTSQPGELAPLVRLVAPQMGLITSLGRAHQEYFRDLAGVAEEKGWLAELLPASGTLFINGDTPGAAAVVKRTRARVVRAGWEAGSDWRARTALVSEAGTWFSAEAPKAEWSGEYQTGLLGRHQVTNALLALAVGAEFGLDRAQLRAGLAACAPPKMRLQLWRVNGVRLLDDSYNANPDSMRAALQVTRELANGGRCIAVLGEMAELGEKSAAAHAELGQEAARLGVDHLLAVGGTARAVVEAARAAGLAHARECPDWECAAAAVKRLALPGDLVLVKASRVARLERLVEELKRCL